MSASAQADMEGVDRRAKGANLVFLNIPKLDSLKVKAGEPRTAPQLVPLVQPATELLEIVRGLAPNSPHVFPGPNGEP